MEVVVEVKREQQGGEYSTLESRKEGIEWTQWGQVKRGIAV